MTEEHRVPLSVALLAFLLASVVVLAAAPSATAAPIQIAAVQHAGDVDFEKELLPILRQNCLPCHSGSKPESGLTLEAPQTMLKGGDSGPAVVAGKAGESLLLKVASHQEEPDMPPDGNTAGAKNLTPEQLGLIKVWIDQGAKGEVSARACPVSWQPLPPGVNPIYAVAITRDGQWTAAARANQVFLYHVPTKRELGRLTDPKLLESGLYKSPGVADPDLIQSLAFSPDGQLLASGGYRTAKLWRRVRNVRKAEWSGLDSSATSLAVSSDGHWTAIGQENGKIKVSDTRNGAAVKTLVGHSAAVRGVAFTPDATQLLSGSADKTLRIWSLADGTQSGLIETPAAILVVALLGDGKQAATAGEDGVVRTWNLADGGKLVKELKGHIGPVTALAANPAVPTQLISGGNDGTIRLWDGTTGNSVRQMNHGGPVTAIAVRPDGQRIASASSNKIAKLWNAANGQQVAEFQGDFQAKLQVDEANRAVALAKRMVDLTKKDLEEANKRRQGEEEGSKKAGEELSKAEADFKAKTEAAKSPLAEKEAADKRLAEAQAALAKAEETQKTADATLKQAGDGAAKSAAQAAKKEADQRVSQAQADVKKIQAEVNRLAGPAQKALDERHAAERAQDAARRSVERSQQLVQEAAAVIQLVNAAIRDAEENARQAESRLEATRKAATDSQQPLVAVAFSHDGATLAAAGAAGQISTFDSETGAPLDAISGQGAAIPFLAFDAEGHVIAVAANNSIVVWDADPTWRLEHVIGSAESSEALLDRVTALAFSPDGKLLATGSGEPSRLGQLKIWNASNGTLLREIAEPHSDMILALEFSPDGKYLASSAADRFMKTWEVETGKLVRTFEGHTHHVLGVTWSADGRTLASCGADKVIKVWDFRSGDQKRTIPGFAKQVTAIRFLADTANVAASCGDANVHVRNTDNGGSVRTLSGSTDFVYCVAASADGKTLVAGGQDSVLRIWHEDGEVQAAFQAPKPDQTAAK